MDIKVANALFDEGVFHAMYKAGFISETIFTYREIYLWVDAQIKTRGISQYKAVLEAEVRFDKSKSTIYEILKKFNTAK